MSDNSREEQKMIVACPKCKQHVFDAFLEEVSNLTFEVTCARCKWTTPIQIKGESVSYSKSKPRDSPQPQGFKVVNN